jgi:glyoxylase I family protein
MFKTGVQSNTTEGDIKVTTTSQQPIASTIGQGVEFHGVRYIISDVKQAMDFYTRHLGFNVEHQQLPAFAAIALGPLKILLSGPAASGSRPLPGGESQNPGGSNRVVLRVTDLPSVISALSDAGVSFRNAMESGPGGRQIQVLDPDGNPVELFEAGRP